MKLTIKLIDRIQLNFILPLEDSFENLLIRDEILEKIKISSKEVELYNIETLKDGQIKFNIKEEKDAFEYEFNESEKNYIKENLIKLSETKKLHVSLLSIYKKIVNG